MQFLRWSEAPREFGSVYHKRAVFPFKGDDIVVDLFVMPPGQFSRPIALTIGRYRDCWPTTKKQKEHFTDPDARIGRLEDLFEMFTTLGVPGEVAAHLAGELDEFLSDECASLRAAMGVGRQLVAQ